MYSVDWPKSEHEAILIRCKSKCENFNQKLDSNIKQNMKVKVVLDLANNYSVNSGVFRENKNYVKEYGNLCSATALYLLALQNEELNKDQIQELVKKCEGLIKLQEEMEQTLFSNKTLVISTKINRKYETNEDFTENVIQNQSLETKDTLQNVEQTYCSETDSDDSNSDLDFKGKTFEEYELFKEQKDNIKARIKTDIQISKKSAFITDSQIVPVQLHDNNTVQEQKSLEMPVKKLKLEVLSKSLVTNNVKDQNDFSLAYAEEKIAKPEIKYFNFSLEQMKSFSQRFQGKTYDSNQRIISSMSGNDLELINKWYNGIYNNCKDFLCPYETRIRESHPTELHAKLRAKALDPYGFMILKNHGRYRPYDSKCQNENCHATLR